MDVNAATETQVALGLDSLRSTRAIHTQVNTPAEINEVFDPIAYEKTSGVLNMIEAYVGPERFRKGVSSYLQKYSLGNAAGEDFWMEMTRVTERPVNRIMKSFVEQAGAPLLSVTSRCVNGTTEVSVKQSRFAGSPNAQQDPRCPVDGRCPCASRPRRRKRPARSCRTHNRPFARRAAGRRWSTPTHAATT
jgi:aminopeptidase N